MDKLSVYLLYSFFLLSLGMQNFYGQNRLRMYPQAEPVYANDAIDFVVVLEDPSDGLVDAISKVSMNLSVSIDTFVFPAAIDLRGSWLGDSSNVDNIVGDSPQTLTLYNTYNSDGPNNSGTGQLAKIRCIATIDDFFEIENDTCMDYTLMADDILLYYIDDVGDEQTEALADFSVDVMFCPKCDLMSFEANPQCVSETQYNIIVNFAGDPSVNYTVSDNLGVTQSGKSGTYYFGPYDNNEQILIAIDEPNNVAKCSRFVTADCLQPIAPASCFDGEQNQNEMGVDCGGVCPDCLDCSMEFELLSIGCYDESHFTMTVSLSGTDAGESYVLSDNLGNNLTLLEDTVVSFGLYDQGTEAIITAQKENQADCNWEVSGKYQYCDDCNFAPENDECAEAVLLSEGENGPYQNYCATINTSETSQDCSIEDLTHTVWYKFTGIDGQVKVTATRCDKAILMDYENDLQFSVFENCGDEVEFACSEDSYLYQPSVSFAAVEGATYYLRVDGYGNYDPTGQFCIDIEYCELQCGIDSLVNRRYCPNIMGYARINASGGNGNFTYEWSNGETGNEISGLEKGIYTVTVSDDSGCACTHQTEVLLDPGLQMDIEFVSPPTGVLFYYNVAEISIYNGPGPFELSWQTEGYVKHSILYEEGDSVFIQVIFSSTANWDLTVEDANGCHVFGGDNAQLDIYDYEIIPFIISTSYGAINITVGGGQSPFYYEWSNGATTEDIVGLKSGWYSVTVTDSSYPTQTATGWYWVPSGNYGIGIRGKDLKEEDIYNNILLFPNPAGCVENIRFVANGKEWTNFQLHIFDLKGQLITQKIYQDQVVNKVHTLNLSSELLKSGMYICRFTSNKGQRVYEKLMVVE